MACRLFGDNPLSESVILSIRTLVTYFNEILFKVQKFPFKKKYMKILSAKMVAPLSRPQCFNKLILG